VLKLGLFGKKNGDPIKVSVFGKTDVGQTRDHNEDAFLVADLSTKNASLKPEVREHPLGPRGTLLVVADGMGGAAAGEVASDLAINKIYEHLSTKWVEDKECTPDRFAFRLRESVEEANAAIHQYAKERPEVRGMGTTTTAAGIIGSDIYFSQVGDSRGYLVRGNEAVQITKDQSLMQRLIDAGEITEEEAEVSDRKNIILQALGPEAAVRVDLTHQIARKDDVIVICSDGLSGLVKTHEVGEVVNALPELQEACSKLIEMANKRGGPDNITVIIARLTGDGLDTASAGEEVGHQVYPLLDTESDTEPVPVYDGSDPPKPKGQAEMGMSGLIAALMYAAAYWYAVVS
jgi:serine/threonine protein phosphatase PrpC